MTAAAVSSVLNEPPGQTAGARPAAVIDLTHYQAGQLAEHVVELISLPAAFRRIVVTMLVTGSVTPIAAALVLPMETLSEWLEAGLYGYSLVSGLVLGFALGGLRVLATATGRIEAILQLVLRIVRQAATDQQRLAGGNERLPTGEELTEQVYRHVITPALEKSAGRLFGLFRRPMGWFYRRTFGFALSRLTSRVARETGEQADAVLPDRFASGIEAVARWSNQVEVYAQSASCLVSAVSTRVRWLAVVPLSGAVVVFATVLFTPLAVVAYLAAA